MAMELNNIAAPIDAGSIPFNWDSRIIDREL